MNVAEFQEEVRTTIKRHNALYGAAKTKRRYKGLRQELEGNTLHDLMALRTNTIVGWHDEGLLRKVQADLDSIEDRLRELNARRSRHRVRTSRETDERVGPQSVRHEAWLRWLIGGGVALILLVAILLLQPALLLTILGVGSFVLALVSLIWFPIFFIRNGLPKSPFAYVLVVLAVAGWVMLCVWLNSPFLVLLPLTATLVALVISLFVPPRSAREEEPAH